MTRQLALQSCRFLLVGATAAVVHLGVAWAAVAIGQAPLGVANAAGFACAFLVSFVGQRRYTFASRAPPPASIVRWLATALAGFLLNQALFLGIMTCWPRLPYLAVLGGVTLAVAGASYLLGRYWAFAGTAGT